MSKTAPYIPQWLKLTAVFGAVWLFAVLPVQATESGAQLHHQAYFSNTQPEREADISSILCNRDALVLISLRASYSFSSSLLFFPSLLSATFSALCLPLLTRLRVAVFPFFFLRLIFEHQIAINAP
ncbi:hypothetical protein WBJ53_09015 [Spirosoma sp. SC4-14]|uniref:hypothetical protein n=1 Tax=Spirosoma sp. SC4-14 TaxID=3128900 RepID=UPI0030D406F3